MKSKRRCLEETPTNKLVETPSVSNVSSQTLNDVTLIGRRIIDIGYFFNCLRQIDNHGPFNCSLSNMIVKSELKNGLRTGIELQCSMCFFTETVWSENPNSGKMSVNTAAVSGIMPIGGGYSNLEEMLLALDIPSMTSHTFQKEHERISAVWVETAEKEMYNAAMEEKRLAIEAGENDSDGVPLLTVVADGSWANYSSLSGATTSGGNESQKVAETSIVIKQEPVESVDEPPRLVIKEIHGAEEIASSSSSLPFNNSSFSCDSISFHEKTLSLANHDSAIVDWSSAEHVNKSARKRKIHDGEPVTPDANQDESCRVTKPSLPSKLTLSTVTSQKSKRTPNAKQAKSNGRTKPSMQSKRTNKPHPPVGTEKKSAGGSTLPTKNNENATREMLQCLLGCSQNNPLLGSRTTERPGDLFDVFADIIANKLREMDWDVCAYALKAILDIAFKADKVQHASKEE